MLLEYIVSTLLEILAIDCVVEYRNGVYFVSTLLEILDS